MRVWRISNYDTLDGAGGLRASGRWHSRGRTIVYCAPNPATALLEVLVHAEIDLDDIPASYRYLEIEIPDRVSAEVLETRSLPTDWSSQVAATRAAGDEWLASRRSAVLAVPSVIVPETRNFLLNPEHPEAAHIEVVRSYTHPFDARLASARL